MATAPPVPAADQLRQDIGRLSAARPDGMPTATLAAALAAEGWVKTPGCDRAALERLVRLAMVDALAWLGAHAAELSQPPLRDRPLLDALGDAPQAFLARRPDLVAALHETSAG